jgi:calmodulin
MSCTEEDLKAAYDELDVDGNGVLELSDLKSIRDSLKLESSDEDLMAIIKNADNNGDGKLSWEEFKKAIVG